MTTTPPEILPPRDRAAAWPRWLLLALVVGGTIAALRYVSVEQLVAQEAALQDFKRQRPLLALALALVTYVVVTGLSLPGAAVLSLVCGWLFGFWKALILVSFGSVLGASCAFLMSRFLLRDVVARRFGPTLAAVNSALEREGAYYLFTLRLLPVVPFFVINLVMGLTAMDLRTFWWVSQLGMLPGTVVYVSAGASLPTLAQIVDRSQLSPEQIQDWPGFVSKLAVDGAPDSSPAARIWSLLPARTRATIERTAAAAVDKPAQIEITEALNQLLSRDDLFSTEAWRETALTDALRKELSRREPQSPRDVRRRNRLLLEKTFPQHIGPPAPILSPQLLIAFTLLGLFPLLIKRLVSRGGVRSPQPDTNKV